MSHVYILLSKLTVLATLSTHTHTIPSISKMAYQHSALFFVVGGTNYGLLSFTFGGRVISMVRITGLLEMPPSEMP
jgi:hypothetical protein